MPFVTKVDYSNNRQVKQFQLTNTFLSGTTTFGLDYSGLTSGVDVNTVITTGTYSNIISNFSGNSTTTIFNFGQPEMNVGAETLEPITNANSGDTQTGLGYEGVNPTFIDGNVVNSAYTGSTFDLIVTSIEEVGVNEWTGTTNSPIVTLLGGDSTDFSGRTIWVDVRGVTRTKRLILTDELDSITGDTITVLGRASNGDVVGVTLSGLTGTTGINSDDYTTSTILNQANGILEFNRLSGGTYNVDLGYTSGDTTNWNSAYDDSITGITVTGSSNKLITLQQRDGNILTANFTETPNTDDYVTGMTFNTSDGDLTLSTLSGDTVTENLDGRYLTGFTIPSTYLETGDNISELVNDTGYITGFTIPSTYLETGDNISELVNDAGYLTGFTETPNTDDYVTGMTFNTTNGILEFTRLSGSTFNIDLDNRYSLTGHTHTVSDITDFPTSLSAFTNDSGYIPYSGATNTVDLNTQNFTTSGTVNLTTSNGNILQVGNGDYLTKYVQIGDTGNMAVRWGLQANTNSFFQGVCLMQSAKPIAFKAGEFGDVAFAASVDPHLLIYPDGNVGIGEIVPDAKLHIVTNGTDNTTKALEIENGVADPLLTILDDGNVGIGTTSPTEKLEVDGNVLSEAFITSGGTASQFVKGDGTLGSISGITTGFTNWDVTDNYTTLSAITGATTDDLVYVLTTPFSGLFKYDATLSAENNFGTIIDGWVRQYEGNIHAEWFDAGGDDDFNVNFALLAAGSIPVELHSDITVNSAILLDSNQTLLLNDTVITPISPMTGAAVFRNRATGTENIIIKGGKVIGTALTNVGYDTVYFSGVTNALIEDMQSIDVHITASIDSANFRFVDCSNSIVDNVYVSGTSKAGVSFTNGVYNEILNSYFTETNDSGIIMVNSDYGKIIGNIVDDCGQSDASNITSNMVNGIFRNNISINASGTVNGNGFTLGHPLGYDAHNTIVEGNVFYNNAAKGIALQGENTSGNTIINNTIIENGVGSTGTNSGGVALLGGFENTISNNVINGNRYGISVDTGNVDIKITNNRIINSTSYGIRNNAIRTKVTDNFIFGNVAGSYLNAVNSTQPFYSNNSEASERNFTLKANSSIATNRFSNALLRLKQLTQINNTSVGFSMSTSVTDLYGMHIRTQRNSGGTDFKYVISSHKNSEEGIDLFVIEDTGELILPQYSGGTITGVPAYELKLDSNGKVITTSLDIDSDVDDYVNDASFNTSNGNLTLTRLSGGTITENLDGRYLTDFTIPSTYLESDDNISELTNDAGYITGFTIPSTYLETGDNISELVNDVGYITGFTDTNNYVDSIIFNPTNGILTIGRNGLADLTEDLDGRYLTNFIIPSTYLESGDNISELTNDAGYITGFNASGNNNEIQFNNGGAFGASSNLIFDGTELGLTGDMYLDGASSKIKFSGTSGTISGFEFYEIGTKVFDLYYDGSGAGATGNSLKISSLFNATAFQLLGSGDLLINGDISSNSFITNGGTASQFVKGDGTLDSNVYLTSANISGVTNTTYTTSAVDSGTNAIIRLSGSDASTDDITLVAGSNVSITPVGDNITFAATNTTYNTATATVQGLIELFSNTVQGVAANAISSTGSRTYGIQLNASGQAVVNVPWSNTNTTNFNIQANGGTQVNISAGEEINFINGNGIDVVVTNQANPTVRFNHKDTSTQASSNNSGRTYIQDITLDDYGHITGLATATETVVNTDTNNYVDSIGFNTGNGILTLGRNGLADLTQDLDGRYLTSFDITTQTDSRYLRSDIEDNKTNGNLILNTNVKLDLGTSNIEGSELFYNGTGSFYKLKTGDFTIQDNATTRFTFERTSGDFTTVGDVYSDRIILSSTVDAALNSTGHALQIGPKSSNNLIIDRDGILTRKDGTTASLILQGEGGNVGIGIATPVGNLHIKNSSNVGDTLVVIEADSDNNLETDSPRLELWQDGALTKGVFGLNGVTDDDYDNGLDNATYVGSLTNTPFQMISNGAVRMTVASGGDVGINKNNPTERLDVTGNIKASGTITGLNALRRTINTKTASYTVVATDCSKILRTSGAGNINITVNTGSLANIGETVEVDSAGTGTVTIVAGTGILRINSNDTAVLDGQYSRVAIQKITSTEYRVFGQLTPA